MQFLKQMYIKTTVQLSLWKQTKVYCLTIFLDHDYLQLHMFKLIHIKRRLKFSWWMIKMVEKELNETSQLQWNMTDDEK